MGTQQKVFCYAVTIACLNNIVFINILSLNSCVFKDFPALLMTEVETPSLDTLTLVCVYGEGKLNQAVSLQGDDTQVKGLT